MLRFYVCILSSLLSGSSFVPEAWAASPLKLRASSTEITTQDRLVMTLVFRSGSQRYPSFRLPRHRRFRLVGQRRKRKREVMYGAGGDTQFQYVWTYTLIFKPRRSGTFRFRPARVRQGRQRYQSQSLTIQVRNPSETIKEETPVLPETILPTGTTFLVPVLSAQRVMVGQQVTLSYYLFSRFNETVSRAQPPPLVSFEVAPLHDMQMIRFQHKRRLQGRIYKVGLALRYALFPRKTGSLRIAPMSLWIQRDSSQDQQQERIQSPSLRVKVVEAPAQEGQTPRWIGRFKARSQPHNMTLAPFAPAHWTVCLRGVGNLTQGRFPKPQLPKGLKIQFSRRRFLPSPHKTLLKGETCKTYFMKANRPGTYKLKGIKILTYDPWKKNHISLQTSPLVLEVKTTSAWKPGQHNVTTKAKPSQPQQPNKRTPMSPNLLWGLSIGVGTAFLFLVVMLWMRRRSQHLEDNVMVEEGPDISERYRTLQHSHQTLQSHRSLQLLKEWEANLVVWMEAYVGDSLQGLSMSEQHQLLRSKGLNQSSLELMKSCRQQCQSLRFFPGEGQQIPADLLDKLGQLLQELPRC